VAGTEAAVLVSNFAQPESDHRLAAAKLPWSDPTVVETRLVDARHNFELAGSFTNDSTSVLAPPHLESPAIALIRRRPVGNGP